MDGPLVAPCAGQGASGALTIKQARKFFEFFRAGTRREVLLLADLVEQPVHYVKSKGYKVLCGSRVGVCELCDKSATSDDIGSQQMEYYAPTFVRVWSELVFEQRVAVFSSAAAEQVRALVPEGSARGKRIDVMARKQGTSTRYEVKPLAGLPAGFPISLPAAFDLVPWIRARYGRPQHPANPLVFLPSFRCEKPVSGPAGRPKPLALSADDCRPAAEQVAEMKSLLGEKLAAWGKPAPAEPPVTPPPAPKPPATRPGVKIDQPPREASTVVGDVLSVLGRIQPTATDDYAAELAMTERTAETICREQKAKSGFVSTKGGAK